MLLEISFAIISIFLLYFVLDNWRTRNFPPGPLRFPIIGTLPQLARADPIAHFGMTKLAKTYGSVMSLKLGTLETVVLSSYEAAKEILNREETLGRQCEGFLWDRNLKQNIGLVYSNEQAWSDMRKFCRETLKKYGFGNRFAMEQLIHEELDQLIKTMERDMTMSLPNSQIHINHTYFNVNFAKLIANVLMPTSDSYTISDLQDLVEHSNDFIQSSLLGTGIVVAFPFLRLVIPGLLGYNVQIAAMRGIYDFAKKLLKIRRNKGRYSTDPECFTDDFLQKIDEDSLKPNPFFTDDQFLVVFADLLQAGSDTTANVVNFTLLQLICNPKIQERLYEEITFVCGTERLPNLNNRSNMPYAQAVFLEGLRWSRTIVLGVPKKVLKDFNYNGYKIQKDSSILTNTQSIFFDEEVWGDPNTFRPERFLDDLGKIVSSKAERIILFGIGKRNCFGEVLARDSGFLFLVTLLQKFKFKLPMGQPLPSVEPRVAIALSPHNYDTIVELRNHKASIRI